MTNNKWEKLSEGAKVSYQILRRLSRRQRYERETSATQAAPKRRLLGARDFVRANQEENLHNIKYKTMEEFRPTRKFSFGSLIPSVAAAGSYKQRRSFQESKPSYANYISNLRNEPVAKTGGTVANEFVCERSSGWSEEVVQELFEETLCGKKCSNWSKETFAKVQGNDDLSILSNEDSSVSTRVTNHSTNAAETIQRPSKILHLSGFSLSKIITRRSPKKSTSLSARKQFCLENRNRES